MYIPIILKRINSVVFIFYLITNRINYYIYNLFINRLSSLFIY